MDAEEPHTLEPETSDATDVPKDVTHPPLSILGLNIVLAHHNIVCLLINMIINIIIMIIMSKKI